MKNTTEHCKQWSEAIAAYRNAEKTCATCLYAIDGKPPREPWPACPQQKAVTAHCTPDIADWLDPNGSLRKAGLMVVDLQAAEGTFAVTV